MRIGIDVGGTNTDAVLLDGDVVVGAVKQPTTADVTGGVVNALTTLLEQVDPGAAPPVIEAVMIGTTHFTNAVVEARRLTPTSCIRLAAPATTALPPGTDWPGHLREAAVFSSHVIGGGHECDGRPIAVLDTAALRTIATELADAGVGAIAVTGVHSYIDGSQERQAEEILREVLPDADITLSHMFGRSGLLERENATVLNASLRHLARHTIRSFEEAVSSLGIAAPLFLSQNDGTVMSARAATELPVATFASGPVNSMRGAALLSGLKDCMIVDIGGTTADVGALQRGFPREAAVAVDIGGVRTNFRMPDVLSVGLGGGSRVHFGDAGVTVGPDSVGFRLLEDGLVFGGRTLTASDIAVAANRAAFGDRDAVRHLTEEQIEAALNEIDRLVGAAIERMRTSPTELPTVVVGGGSVLVGAALPGAGDIVRPPHYGCANAVGAAIAQVGADIERVVSLDGRSRHEVIEQASAEAIERCVAAGARPASVEVVDVDEVPVAYVAGGTVRLRVRAIGDLEVTTHAS